MIWFALQEVGFYIFLFLTIYYVIKRKYEALLVLYFWGMVFATCYKFAFTIWFPTKVVSIGMLVCIFRDSGSRFSSVKGIASKLTSIFLVLLIISDIWGINLPKEFAPNFSQASRMINQSYTYISAFIILFYGKLLEPGFVKRIYPSYMFAIEVCIIIGLIHYACMRADIPFMPILRQDGSVNMGESVVAQFGTSVVSRIYGFAGEPKGLGFTVLPYLLLSVIAYNNGFIRKSNKYHLGFLIAGTFVLIQTYSSAALMNFALAIPIIMTFFTTKKSVLGITLLVAICIAGISLVGVKIAGEAPSDNPNFIESFYDRTFGRAESELEDDRQETVVYEAFKKTDIISQTIGWGVAQYTFHAPDQTIGGALIPVQSGLVLTLTDFGFLGLFYYLMIGIVIWRLLWNSKLMQNEYSLAFSIAAFSSFVGSLMFGMMVNCFVYMMLALYAYHDEIDYYEELEVEHC